MVRIVIIKNDSSSSLETVFIKSEASSKTKDPKLCKNCKYAQRKLDKALYCEKEEVLDVSLFYCQLKENLVEAHKTCGNFRYTSSSY